MMKPYKKKKEIKIKPCENPKCVSDIFHMGKCRVNTWLDEENVDAEMAALVAMIEEIYPTNKEV